MVDYTNNSDVNILKIALVEVMKQLNVCKSKVTVQQQTPKIQNSFTAVTAPTPKIQNIFTTVTAQTKVNIPGYKCPGLGAYLDQSEI